MYDDLHRNKKICRLFCAKFDESLVNCVEIKFTKLYAYTNNIHLYEQYFLEYASEFSVDNAILIAQLNLLLIVSYIKKKKINLKQIYLYDLIQLI